ncbi:protein kinase [Achlya hypogyna]|uniref:Protein kinase n=1 Tax=Achlya hypogyna TaxID=1202772 RepID=A0A1V9YR10_ACHHY|nr:protein kinase [Achlya hypogyna]
MSAPNDVPQQTPLYLASENDNVAAVQGLIAAGASVDELNKDGWTPLDIACKNGHVTVVQELIEAGASVNRRHKVVCLDGNLPLHHATREGHENAVRLLVDADGADVNATNNAGDTPLHLAVRYNRQRLLELLLQTKGVSTTICNMAGDSPLIVAVKLSRRRFAQQIYAGLTVPSREVAATDIAVDSSKVLGRGGNSIVQQGVFNNQTIVVKSMLDLTGVDALIRELEAMQLCKSPYVVQLLAISGPLTPRPQLVLEYMDAGNLRGYLDQKIKGELVPVEYSILDVALIVANALGDLHHNGLMHRNIKSHNVMLSTTQYIKLADIGLARTYSGLMTMGTGALLWTAPEMLAEDGHYTFAADIYSFGVLLTELSTLQLPYTGLGLSQLAILNRVRSGTLRPDIGAAAPGWLRKLATDCMAQNPFDRPSAQKIMMRLDRQRRLENDPSADLEEDLDEDENVDMDPSSGSGSGGNRSESPGPRHLFEAVATGDVARMSELLAKGEDPNATNNAGDTPLHVAVQCNQQQILQLLLRTKGINVVACNKIYKASTVPPREVAATDIDVDHDSPLGSGNFSVVYKGTFNDQPVAVKTVYSPTTADTLTREMKAMQLCNSPYLLHLLAVSDPNTSAPQLVLEFMDGGDLRQYLNKKRDGLPVDVEYSALDVAWVIASALADLHQNGVLHRDLKSNNVLLSSKSYVKVADLGLARTFATHMTLGIGTLLWAAPEVLAKDGHYSYAADIYSFGVILTELGTLQMPFATLSPWVALEGVCDGSLRSDVGVTSPQWLRDLATDCLAFEPAKRPSAEDVLKRLDRQRRLEVLELSTTITCDNCKAWHALHASVCPNCDGPAPKAITKLERLLESIDAAKKRGINVRTTLPCNVCDAVNGILATACSECENELPSDIVKLQLLVKIVNRALQTPVAA